jgi:hypothetical protein
MTQTGQSDMRVRASERGRARLHLELSDKPGRALCGQKIGVRWLLWDIDAWDESSRRRCWGCHERRYR